MGGDDLVFDSKMVQCEDVFGGSALESVQIFDLKVVLVPLKFQAGPICHQSFQVRFVQQIVDSFFVDLEVTTVDCELLPTSTTFLLYHFKE